MPFVRAHEPQVWWEIVSNLQTSHVGVISIHLHHRIYGPPVTLGEPSCSLTVYTEHRKEGFEVVMEGMEKLKGKLPIWKNEGGEWGANKEWKGGR